MEYLSLASLVDQQRKVSNAQQAMADLQRQAMYPLMTNACWVSPGDPPTDPYDFNKLTDSELYNKLADSLKFDYRYAGTSAFSQDYKSSSTIHLQKELEKRKRNKNMFWESNNNEKEMVNLDHVSSFWLYGNTVIKIFLKSGKVSTIEYNTSVLRDSAFERLKTRLNLVNKLAVEIVPEEKQEPQKESKMKEIVNDLKKFVSEHRNVIYTVALIALADHFLFNGKFREKLHNFVDKLLSRAEKQLDDKSQK